MFKGVMFHHFHSDINENETILQGSIEQNIFEQIIKYLQREYRLIDAKDWIEKANKNKLMPNDICLTFDDSIKNQFAIAKPVLDTYNIKAFFFAYTGMYHGYIPRLELYRLFRVKYFESFDVFYAHFIENAEKVTNFEYDLILRKFPEGYLKQMSFYSKNERVFRYIRDIVFSREIYQNVMDSLILNYTTLIKLKEKVWMSQSELKKLGDEGHEIGLHSVTHPTLMAQEKDHIQKEEYSENKRHLEEITANNISAVAYPSGSYNNYTLGLMNNLNIKIGFRADQKVGKNMLLETPRIDSTDIYNLIYKK